MNRGLSRRSFLKTAGLGTLSLATPGCMGGALKEPYPRGDRPNILFIMLDDLGPEWISGYGGEEMETPHIDRLAREGMRFTHAYSMPKCTPTRATLLTGQYPFRTGWINHWDVPRWGCGCHFDWNRYTTFGQVMKKAGYATAAAGKWQINDFRVQPAAMAGCGFDEYCMWTGYETGVKASAERYADPYIHTREGSRTYQGCFGEDVFTDFLISFMKRNREEPMMLYYPMCLTHGPLTPTPLDPGVEGKYETFKAMIRYADHMLGKLVHALEELGLREKTVIIFTSDNGAEGGFTARMMGRPVKGGKGRLTETGMNVPFIVSCPGRVPGGVVTRGLTDFTDLLPTFADLGGAPLPEGMVLDGRSMAPFLLGKTEDTPREWIMAMGGGVAKRTEAGVVPRVEYADRVVRDKRFKLWVEKGESTRLYDLRQDPGEEYNLIESADPEAAEALIKLEAVVKTFPEKDSAPRYEPLPPQPWDLKPNK